MTPTPPTTAGHSDADPSESTPPPDITRERNLLQLACWAVAGITLVAYLPTILTAEFIDLDDGQYVLNNPRVRSPSLTHVATFFREVHKPSTVAGYYQPLTMVSLMADAWIGGSADSPTFFHLTSVLLHAINAVLVLLIARAACGGILVPACAALVFALHPLQVESVVWISQRKTVLSAAGALLCIWTYLLSARCDSPNQARTYRAISLAGFIVALLAKPTALLVPVFLLMLVVWPLRASVRAALRAHWPYVVLMLLFAWIAAASQAATADLAIPNLGGDSLLQRLDRTGRLALLCAYNLLLYAWHVVWPVNLGFIYAIPEPVAWHNMTLLLAAGAAVAMLVVIILSARRWPALFTALGGFVVLLAVALGPVRFYQSCVGDRFVYLPLAALCMGFAALLTRLSTRAAYSPTARLACVAVTGVILSLLARGTLDHQQTWGNSESLWVRALQHAPDSPLANSGMATVRLRAAEQWAAQAAQARADGDASAASGNVNTTQADDFERRSLAAAAECVQFIDRAMAVESANGTYYGTRGEALLILGRPAEAIAAFEHALLLGLGPLELDGYMALGRAWIANGEPDRAAQAFDQGISRRPDQVAMPTHMSMGSQLGAVGRADLALRYFRRAAELSPADEQALGALGAAAAATGDYPLAARALAEARDVVVNRNEDAPELTLSLAKVHLELGLFADASRLFEDPATRRIFPMESLLGRASAAAGLGNLDVAFSLLSQLTPHRPEILDSLARKPWTARLREDSRWLLLARATSQPVSQPTNGPTPP